MHDPLPYFLLNCAWWARILLHRKTWKGKNPLSNICKATIWKKCIPPETAIIYAVKKQIVVTISTAGTTLFSWNKTNIFHGYKVENHHSKMKSYPKFPFSHIMLFVFPLIASKLDSFSRHVGSFIADQKVENMCLEDQLLKCKHCWLNNPDDWKHQSKYERLLLPFTEANYQTQ